MFSPISVMVQVLLSHEGGKMGQVLHGSAVTAHAVRGAIQRSAATITELSARYGFNPKTVAKWRKRDFVSDAPMGPK